MKSVRQSFIKCKAYWVFLLKKNIDCAILLFFGFLLRLSFLFQPFMADEFYDILASLMITYKGFPELPSGNWWLSGGANLYFQAAFLKVFGPLSYAIRIPSLLMSTLSIFVIYKLGALINKRVAIVASFLWAIDLGALEWGGYARQYAIFPLCFFTSVFFFYKAGLRDDFKHKDSFFAFLFYFLAVWSHAPAMFFLPSLVLFYGSLQIKKIRYDNFFSSSIFKNISCLTLVLCLISGVFYKIMNYLDSGLLYSAAQVGSLLYLPFSFWDFGCRIYYFLYSNFFNAPVRFFSFSSLVLYICFFCYKIITRRDKYDKKIPKLFVALVLVFSSNLIFMALFCYGQPGYALGLVGILYVIAGICIDALLSTCNKYMKYILYSVFCVLIVCASIFNFNHRRVSADNNFEYSVKAFEYVIENAEKGDAILSSDPLFFIMADLHKKSEFNYYHYCVHCGLTLVKKEEKLYDRFLGGRNIRNISDVDELFKNNKRVWWFFFEHHVSSAISFPKIITNHILRKMKKVCEIDKIRILKYG